jgi:hypothetical protein
VDLQDDHDESNVLPELVVCEVVDYDVHVAGTDKVVMDPDFVRVFCGQSVFVFVAFVTHEVRRCVCVETLICGHTYVARDLHAPVTIRSSPYVRTQNVKMRLTTGEKFSLKTWRCIDRSIKTHNRTQTEPCHADADQ